MHTVLYVYLVIDVDIRINLISTSKACQLRRSAWLELPETP